LPPEQMAGFLNLEGTSSPIAIYGPGNSQNPWAIQNPESPEPSPDSDIFRLSREDRGPHLSPIQSRPLSEHDDRGLSGDGIDISPYTPSSFGLPPEETKVSGTSTDESLPPPAIRRHAGYYGPLDQAVSSGSGRLGTIAEEN
jgi:hypothetical protein